MLEKLHSGTAIDAVTSAKAPKPDSRESVRNGATFQSHYASADKRQENSDVGISRGSEAKTADPSTDEPTGENGSLELGTPEVSEEGDNADGTEGAVATASASETVPASKKQSVGLVQAQTGTASTEENEVEDSQIGLSTADARRDPAKSASTPELAPAASRSGQQAPRSLAEIRIASVQADRAAQGQGVEVVAPGVAKADAGQAVEIRQAGQETQSAAAGNQQAAAASQAFPQIVKNEGARRSASAVDALQQKSNALLATNTAGQGQANPQGLAGLDAAMQQMTDSQDDVRVQSVHADDARRDAPVQVNRSKSATANSAANQSTTAVQSVMASQVGNIGAETMLDPTKASLMVEPMFVEPAGLSQLLTEAVMSPGTTHRPETPRLVAVQLAEALATKGERNIDVALNPEELGRVKMRVSTTDTSVTIMITTERPETGDLMRRHINELSEEFRRMGFEDVKFEFSGEGMSGQMGEGSNQGGLSGQGSTRRGDNDLATETKPEVAQKNLNLGETGMDMRV